MVDWTTGSELTEKYCADALCATEATDSVGTPGTGAATWTFVAESDGDMCDEKWTYGSDANA